MLKVRCQALVVGGWAVIAMGAGVLEAAPLPISVLCPGTAVTTDREFSLTATTEALLPSVQGDATVGCHATGTGNLNEDEFSGWVLIDKDENGPDADGGFSVTGNGGTTGSFSILASTWDTYNQLIIGFKPGTPNSERFAAASSPDWAAFLLTGGITGGTWDISGQWGLSHADLFGRFVPPDRDITAVPEPASLLLLGSGLLSAVTASRRRRKAKS